ncbi:MAG: mannose-1-phosphate guanylyltransferase [Leptospiraceae bacterium]|nr:mannose-1-phosphate guanylyltransferase [Leptospiraceae bacterium]
MAGGKGERFWPKSTASHPKQLQKIYSHRTLLEETVRRARLVTSADRIYVGCNAELKKTIQKIHPELQLKFVVEPSGRNTAPIIALSALQLQKKHPGATMVVMSADHYIDPPAKFKETLKTAILAARHGKLVTLGIVPTRPDSGYGYIQKGASSEKGVFAVKSFKEKPDSRTALTYLKKGYLWNSGIFIWSLDTILQEFRNHCPEILLPLEKAGNSAAGLKKAFPRVPELPVDIAIMEKSRQASVVPASFHWDDVGSWTALERIVEPAQKGITLVGPSSQKLVQKDSSNSVVVSDRKLVAMLGVKDLILVEEGDVLFVSSREGLGGIKELLKQLKQNPTLQKYLR